MCVGSFFLYTRITFLWINNCEKISLRIHSRKKVQCAGYNLFMVSSSCIRVTLTEENIFLPKKKIFLYLKILNGLKHLNEEKSWKVNKAGSLHPRCDACESFRCLFNNNRETSSTCGMKIDLKIRRQERKTCSSSFENCIIIHCLCFRSWKSTYLN